jgi:hypothetical protein
MRLGWLEHRPSSVSNYSSGLSEVIGKKMDTTVHVLLPSA